MPVIAYFGDRYDTFQKAAGCIEDIVETAVLPPAFPVDVIVIDSKPKHCAKVPLGSIGVVCSDNREGLQTLMKCGVRTVTCGMSYRDTVTLTERNDRLTVCLRRRLPIVGGKVAEPSEFPVESGDYDTDCLLLASAVRLLCGFKPE